MREQRKEFSAEDDMEQTSIPLIVQTSLHEKHFSKYPGRHWLGEETGNALHGIKLGVTATQNINSLNLLTC
jgi:hypothetical protein